MNCYEQVEAEANFAAGRLLFLREQFTDEARSLDPSIKAVQQLHHITYARTKTGFSLLMLKSLAYDAMIHTLRRATVVKKIRLVSVGDEVRADREEHA